MYQYDEQDRLQLTARNRIFHRQIERNLAGKMSDDAFRPIRLQQGLYIQRQAPMLRVAIPYGMISARQLRTLAAVAREYDKSYCHITTRQNIQFNWVAMGDVPKILSKLAETDLHSIQTSGNCIRNITSDPFSGVAQDEIVDSRPYCEIIRQWSLGHPEFAFLPRKFKISISGSQQDRAITQAHDIGLRAVFNDAQKLGFQVWVGGGLGRTPIIGSVLSEFILEKDILDYLTAILRIYNQHGRRDNKYKARIKILVKSIGIEQFRAQVKLEWERVQVHGQVLHPQQVESFKSHFKAPEYRKFDPSNSVLLKQAELENQPFSNWLSCNTSGHIMEGYRCVTLSLKSKSVAPGDITSAQLEAIAQLCEQYSFGEVRTTHQQNIVFADVNVSDLFGLWNALKKLNLASPNIGTINDIICCPGLDFCSLANAQSIPIAQQIQNVFEDIDYVYSLGDLSLNISGCMNACTHHHLANIGILGVDKKGQQFYQISLGGIKSNDAQLGKILGPSFAADQVPEVVKKIIHIFLEHRQGTEHFIDTLSRIGLKKFKEGVYEKAH